MTYNVFSGTLNPTHSLTDVSGLCVRVCAVEKCPICTCCYDSSARSHDNRRHSDGVASWCRSVFSALSLRDVPVSCVAALAPAVQKVRCLKMYMVYINFADNLKPE